MVLEMVKAVVQIAFMTVLFYYLYNALYRGGAAAFANAIIFYLFIYLIAVITGLGVLKKILSICALPYVAFLSVLYQPELRRGLIQGFNKGFFKRGVSKTSSDQVDGIISACKTLVQSKRGALIVFPRHVSIKNIIETGTKLNADISSALIVTIFEHDTPLHDGALIVQDGRIIAAGCYLPLSQQRDISASFGTRHRAALGLAEESDAVVMIVSEETGAISLAYGANLYYNLDERALKSTLLALFNSLDVYNIKPEAENDEK
ncbi:MAG: diadenylate cyclase CdaA [Sphaerochaetaceae bacterium]|nr:diadenylate cyclase CdaA [Sphaerochaetaceae bacterium]